MRHKTQYTTKQLRNLKAHCHDIIPVWGRYEGMPPAEYLPRSKFDPKPWAINGRDGFRYSAYELTAIAQHAPEVADEQWIEQRHYADLDGSDAAFTHMFDNQVQQERALAGVAA